MTSSFAINGLSCVHVWMGLYFGLSIGMEHCIVNTLIQVNNDYYLVFNFNVQFIMQNFRAPRSILHRLGHCLVIISYGSCNLSFRVMTCQNIDNEVLYVRPNDIS